MTISRRDALSEFVTGLGIGIIMGAAAYFIPGDTEPQKAWRRTVEGFLSRRGERRRRIWERLFG